MKAAPFVAGLALLAGAAACTAPTRPIGRQVMVIPPPRDVPGSPSSPPSSTAATVPSGPPASAPEAAAAEAPASGAVNAADTAAAPGTAGPPVAIATPVPVPSPPPPTPIEVSPSATAAPEPASAPAPAPAPAAPDASVAAAGSSRGTAMSPAAHMPSPATEPAGVIFFKPDAYKFEPSYRGVLLAHARRLKASPELHLVIQAYTDSYGAIDYNLALSKKRAETVARFLREQGVPAEQLELVYHGERHRGGQRSERLAADNRRVELMYRMP